MLNLLFLNSLKVIGIDSSDGQDYSEAMNYGRNHIKLVNMTEDLVQ